jgi:DNA-binding response OmpR family regulator
MRCDGAEVQLSRLEAGILERLLARQGRVATRAELIAEVWATTYTGGSNVVDSVVRTLRRKLDGTDLSVETVRGLGYRVRSPAPGPIRR